MFEPLCAALDAAGIACTRNELLADHCTFRIGGPADIFIKPCDEIQLCRAVAFCKEQGARYYLLWFSAKLQRVESFIPAPTVTLQ